MTHATQFHDFYHKVIRIKKAYQLQNRHTINGTEQRTPKQSHKSGPLIFDNKAKKISWGKDSSFITEMPDPRIMAGNMQNKAGASYSARK